MTLGETMQGDFSLSREKTYLITCASGQITVGLFTGHSSLGQKSFVRVNTTSGKEASLNVSYVESIVEV